MLCYLNAVLALLTLFLGAGISLLLLLLGVTGYFIANDRRWAYWTAIGIVALYVLGEVVAFTQGAGLGGLIDLLFAVVLFALLLHPQSRAYQRTFFH